MKTLILFLLAFFATNAFAGNLIEGKTSLIRGGTNKAMVALPGAVVYSDSDSLELTSQGTSGYVLQSNGTTLAPSWTNSLSTTLLSGVVPMSKGGTEKALTPSVGGMVYTDSDSMEILSAGTTGYYLKSNGAGAAPSWAAVAGGSTSYIEIFQSTITSSSTVAGIFHFKCPVGLTFTSFTMQIFEKGLTSSGTLAFDVLKGTNPGTMTSIFSATPSINFATASNYDSASGTQSTTTCSAGDFLRLDLTQVPAGWIGATQVILYGTP